MRIGFPGTGTIVRSIVQAPHGRPPECFQGRRIPVCQRASRCSWPPACAGRGTAGLCSAGHHLMAG
jgi:hypothetical protein